MNVNLHRQFYLVVVVILLVPANVFYLYGKVLKNNDRLPAEKCWTSFVQNVKNGLHDELVKSESISQNDLLEIELVDIHAVSIANGYFVARYHTQGVGLSLIHI